MEIPPKSDASSHRLPTAPTRLGKYPVHGVVGRGSMGIVYKSVDPHIKRPVALKTIRSDVAHEGDGEGENFSERFRTEARAAGSLAHPGIVAIYEYGEEDSYAYIAMEYVEGRSLRDCFEKKVSFSLTQIIDIFSQLLEALQYAHIKGVVHRDIKPANILITPHDRVKVTDFGIARMESSMLTQIGVIMGTPGFIAPEMYLSATFDHRVDLFAAGVVLYQLMAGTLPFMGTPEKVMFKVCYETPLPPSVVGRTPTLQPFDAVVMKALARQPAERYSSAGEFLTALLQAKARTEADGAVSADETIIVPRAGKDAASRPISTDTLRGVGWDMEVLKDVEERLVRFVGPIAKIMVRRAAKETTDVVALTELLASRIIGAAERDAFLKATGIASVRPVGKVPRSGPQTLGERQFGSGPQSGAQRLLTPEEIARIAKVFVVYVGPIADILAKRAAKSGCTREQFIATLAAYLKDEGARSRFIESLD